MIKRERESTCTQEVRGAWESRSSRSQKKMKKKWHSRIIRLRPGIDLFLRIFIRNLDHRRRRRRIRRNEGKEEEEDEMKREGEEERKT